MIEDNIVSANFNAYIQLDIISIPAKPHAHHLIDEVIVDIGTSEQNKKYGEYTFFAIKVDLNNLQNTGYVDFKPSSKSKIGSFMIPTDTNLITNKMDCDNKSWNIQVSIKGLYNISVSLKKYSCTTLCVTYGIMSIDNILVPFGQYICDLNAGNKWLPSLMLFHQPDMTIVEDDSLDIKIA